MKKSKWILTGDHHFCFECEQWALYEEGAEEECLSAFCPFCGAKMENGMQLILEFGDQDTMMPAT